MTDLADPAISIRFKVTIDGWDLGLFTGCKGLGCTLAVERLEEGGNQGFVHQLPGRMSYSNIVVTRPVDGSSATVARWISQMAVRPQRTTGCISVMTFDGTSVASWGLIDVIPVRWTGPDLSSDSGGSLATETLELAHHGFTDPGTPG